MRIVSLLPSATEILFALGVGDQIVGVTFECDYPEQARSCRIVSTSALDVGLSPREIDQVVKERVAAGEDLYKLDRGALSDLDPTLVVTQDLCAVCAVDVAEVDDALEYLACSAEILTLDPMTLTQVLRSIEDVGRFTGTQSIAQTLVASLHERLDRVSAAAAGRRKPDVLVLEWTDPAFTAGHWVPDLVEAAGGRAVLANPGENSVGIDWEAVQGSKAEVVVVSPCGFRLPGASELTQELLRRDVLPSEAEVWSIDADHLMVRPGPRVVDGVETLAAMFHPGQLGAPDPMSAVRLR